MPAFPTSRPCSPDRLRQLAHRHRQPASYKRSPVTGHYRCRIRTSVQGGNHEDIHLDACPHRPAHPRRHGHGVTHRYTDPHSAASAHQFADLHPITSANRFTDLHPSASANQAANHKPTETQAAERWLTDLTNSIAINQRNAPDGYDADEMKVEAVRLLEGMM